MSEEEIKFQTLHDHYKDTFALQREYLKLRDRLFVYTLLVFAAMFIFTIVPMDPSKAVTDFVKEQFKVTLSLNRETLNTILWFVLLCLVVRYFQTNIVVERQYNYIHMVENELNSLYNPKGEMFTREGKSYLGNFQTFSTLAGYLYILVFPMLLVTVTTYNIYTEVMTKTSFDQTLVLDIVFWLLLFIYTIVYSISIHLKKIYNIWFKVKIYLGIEKNQTMDS
jgi:hypothetical protein